MPSETSICNLALSQLGSKRVTNLMNPETAIEQLCAEVYPSVRDAVLEAHNWTFAIARSVLDTPLAEAPEWGMSNAFQLPSDTLRVIWAGSQPDESMYETFDWRVEGGLLLTDQRVIYLRYLRHVTEAHRFTPLFVQALSCRLAMELCVPVTENVGLYQRLMEVYAVKVSEAIANDGMQGRSQRVKQRNLLNVR